MGIIVHEFNAEKYAPNQKFLYLFISLCVYTHFLYGKLPYKHFIERKRLWTVFTAFSDVVWYLLFISLVFYGQVLE